MKHTTHRESSWAVVHDASLRVAPGLDEFNVDFWRSRQALSGEAIGRGSAWFVETPNGPVVLRHYLRGGWAAKLSRQAYFFSGISKSRPFREYHILAELFEKGLPVPRPVAALCQHKGFIATGAIMTACIASATTLADVVAGNDEINGLWASVGRCIRKFHNAGVWHADLNARNILLDFGFRVYLIDFDKARLQAGKPVNGEDNLNRLKRSLIKFWPVGQQPAMDLAWAELKAAYNE